MMVRFLRCFCALGLLLMAVGCTSTPVRTPEDRYVLEVVDNAAERRFELVLKSHDDRAICIQVDKWPNRLGQLHMGSDIATLITERGALEAADENFGYCPGGCGQHRIEARQELRGIIAYEAFGDPMPLVADTAKRLQFSVTPFYCLKK